MGNACGCGGGDGDQAGKAAAKEGSTKVESVVSRLSEAGNRFVMIKFFKPDSPGMVKVHETYCNYADTYTDIIFMEADATANPEAVSDLQIRNLPAFLAFKNHTEVGRYEGSDMGEVKTLIVQLLSKMDKKKKK